MLTGCVCLFGVVFALTGCSGNDTFAESLKTDGAEVESQAALEGHTRMESAGEKVVRLTDAELEEFDIEVREAGPGEMLLEKTYPGEIRINEDRYAHVTPRVPGVVRSVRASLGDDVRAGEVMAVLESRELADMKSNYLAAVERLHLAQSNYEREERLFEKKISSEQEYLEAKQTMAEAGIDVRSAEQKLRAIGFSEDYIKKLPEQAEASLTVYPLTAPFDGTVVEKHIVQGEALDADSEVFGVADLSTVWADLSIYQKDMGLIQEGQAAVISAVGYRERGTISYLRPIVGEDTRTALARIILPNPHRRWKPGMFVEGRISVDRKEMPVVIPKSALQTIGDQKVVFIKTAEGFTPRPVEISEENSDQAAIAGGLTLGDIYVASGGFVLKSELLKGETSTGHAH